MKRILLGIFCLALLVSLISCQKENIVLTDQELIEAIQSADKTLIDLSELPESAKQLIETDYSKTYAELLQKASGLGYEATLRWYDAEDLGSKASLYFDLKGKQLRGDKDEKHDRKKGCVEVIFPVTVIFPDGSELIAGGVEEIRAGIKEWFSNNPETDEKPTFKFPIEVLVKGEQQTVQTEEDWIALRKSCWDQHHNDDDNFDEEDGKCFDVIFPVTIVFPDGSELIAGGVEEIRAAFKDWFSNNPDSDEKPRFVFPITVVVRGEQQIVHTDEDWIALRESCKDDEIDDHHGHHGGGHHGGKCFDIIFPVTIVFPDGSELIAGGVEEIRAAFKDWFQNNPDSDEKPRFVFPITVAIGDEQIVLQTDEDWIALREACKGDEDDHEVDGDDILGGDCFDVVFPVTIVFPNGSELIAGGVEEIRAAFEDWFQNNPNSDGKPRFVYPIAVVIGDQQINLQTDEDWIALRERCKEDHGEEGDHDNDDDFFGGDDCFDVVFPVTVVFPNGSELIAGGVEEIRAAFEDWYIDHPDTDVRPEIKFPLEVIIEDGSTVIVKSAEELRRLQAECRD